jgi:hypothetical protein
VFVNDLEYVFFMSLVCATRGGDEEVEILPGQSLQIAHETIVLAQARPHLSIDCAFDRRGAGMILHLLTIVPVLC